MAEAAVSGSPQGDGDDPLVTALTIFASVLELFALVSHEAGAQAASLVAWVLRWYLDRGLGGGTRGR